MQRIRRASVSILTALTALGCAGANVKSVHSYAGDQALPEPDVVLVYDFDLTGADILLESAAGAEIERAVEDTSTTEKQLELGRDVAGVLAEQLVEQIRALGLPAERAFAPPMSAQNTLMVSGNFVTIDQGNRSPRATLGFGTGNTGIRTRVTVYQAGAEGPRLLEEFATEASGSKKRGRLVPVGAGAPAERAASSAALGGGASVVAENLGGVGADAQRSATEIARRIGYLAARQGWIPMQAVK